MSDSLQPHGLNTPDSPAQHQLLELAQTHVHRIGDTIQPLHSLLSPSPPAFNLSQDQGRRSPWSWEKVSWFSKESALCIMWPKYWSFSFSISPYNDIQDWFSLGLTGLISLQAKGLSRVFPTPQFKTSILLCSAFFIVQLSHPYMTTGKNHSLD